MHAPIFYLSNGQAKELSIRNTPLLIALPAPEDDPDDWLTWARESIAQFGDYVVSAEPQVITVAPAQRDGLEGVFGRIVHADHKRPALTIGVDAVVVELDPKGKPRSPRTRLQWPGSVRAGSQSWPAKPPAAVGSRGDLKPICQKLLSALMAHRHACHPDTVAFMEDVKELLAT